MAFAALIMFAGAAVSGCPDSIHDNQLVGPVLGWDIRVEERPRTLANVSVYVGPPSLGQVVKPLKGAGGSQTWQLAGKGEFFVECRYHGSSAVLSRKLGAVGACTLRQSKGAGLSLAKFECN